MTLIVLIVVSISALAGAGFLYQWLGARMDLRRNAGAGRWVEIGTGQRLYVREMGVSGPVVVFEAGIAATSLNWCEIQNRVAKFARTASYDRAGLGWSGPSRTPRTPARVAGELRSMLRGAGIDPPFVLVGHSFGGLVMRRFALEYPGEVASLVLVDPMRCDEWPPLNPGKQPQLDRGKRMSRYAVPIARLGLARLAVTSLFHGDGSMWRWLAGVTTEGPQRVLERVSREMAKLPPQVRPMVAAYWSLPSFYRGMHEHLAAVPETVREMMDAEPIAGIPLLVLTPDKAEPLSEESLRAIGDNARQVIAPDSAHWVHLDQPDLVVSSIREMVAASRERAAATL